MTKIRLARSATVEDVPGTSSPRIAAPRGLARLIVIFGVLIGLTGLQGSHCGDEFGALVHAAKCPTSDTYDPPELNALNLHGAVMYHALSRDPHVPIGAAALCLAVLMAVLLVMVWLSGPVLLGTVLLRAGPWLRRVMRDWGAPKLAMLCVLRT
ncbi:hypothetical protein [Kibdelosporangium aridum]|uniref:Uncharacterized protein n=1 Tax=Kibdelosporangium aridum TaxID=2030 RepID=A0A1Y5WRL7_KIBAR|nr:hypothetical protein [Kibdelosporangium aridum]SMC47454.1 hypothetical protein SAMN05661093_00038 [Kibdelosporangium aridum]